MALPSIKGLRAQQPLFKHTPVEDVFTPSGAAEASKGVTRGVANVKAGFADAARIATDAVGAEGASKQLDEFSTRTLREAQRFAPRVKSLKDAETLEDYVDFFTGGVAESAPFLATTIAGGGAGGALAKLLGGSVKKGAATGAFGSIATPETGFTFREIEEETGEKRPGLSILAGAGKGALDVFSTAKALKSFLPKGLGRKGGKFGEIAKTAAREGVTEAAQELIDIEALRVAKNESPFAPLSPDEFQRGIDVAALGAVGGTAISGAGVTSRVFRDRISAAQDLRDDGASLSDILRKGYDDMISDYGAERTEGLRASMGDEAFTDMLSQMAFEESENFTTLESGEAFSVLNKNSDPWPSLELWKFGGVANPQDALEVQRRNANERDPLTRREIRNMRREGATEAEIETFLNEQSPYQRTSYLEFLKEKASENELSYEDLLESEADRLVTKSPRFAEAREALGAEKFLDQFEYIRKEPVSEVFEDDPLARPFTETELKGPKGEKKDDKRSRAIIRPARFNKQTGTHEPRFGEVIIRTRGTKEGEQVTETKAVNLQALVIAMMKRVPGRAGESLTDRVASALYSGVTTLATTGGVQDINLKAFDNIPRNIAADIVVFQQKQPNGITRQITLAEVQTRGPARAAARAFAAKLRVSKARGRLVNIEKKMNRLKEIPVEIASTADQAEITKLEAEYVKLSKDARTLERDRQTAVKEMGEAITAAEKFEQQDDVSLDPREEVEEVTDVEAVEPVKKQKIERGFTQSDNPNTESLFNHNQNDEQFEVSRGEEDFKDEAELLVNRVDELKDAGSVLERTDQNDQNVLAGIFHAVHGRELKPAFVPTEEELAQRKKPKSAEVAVKSELQAQIVKSLAATRKRLDVLQRGGKIKFSLSPYDLGRAGTITGVDTTNWNEHKGVKRAAKIVADFVRKVGLEDVVFLTPETAYLIAFETGKVDNFLNGKLNGFAASRKTIERYGGSMAVLEKVLGADAVAKAKTFIYVNPEQSVADMEATAAHEVGHAVYFQQADALTGKEAQAIYDEYNAWLKKAGKDKRILLTNRPEELIRGMVHGLVPGTSTFDERFKQGFIDYVNEFEEWFADQTRNRLVDPSPPKNVIHSVLDKLIAKLDSAFNAGTTQYNSVADYIDSLMRRTHPSWGYYVSPDEVMNNWQTENQTVRNSESVENGNDVPSDLLRQISEFFNTTLGRPLNRTRDAELIARMANLQNADAIGAAFHQVFVEAINDETLFTAEERGILGRAANTASVRRQLKNMLGPDAWAAAKDDVATSTAYMYQFWMSGQIDLGSRTRNLFQKIADFLAGVAGIARDHQNVEELLQNFTNGRALLRKMEPGENHFIAKRAVRDTLVQKAVQDYFAPAWAAIKKSSLTFPLISAAGTRMGQTKNPVLIKLSNMMGVRIGSTFQGADMLTERTKNIGRFTNDARKIFEGKSEEHGEQVVELLNSGKAIPTENRTEVQQDAADVHALMDRMFLYMRDKGLDVKKIDNYFPWVFDYDFLSSHRQEFIDLMSAPNFATKFTDHTPEDLYTAISMSNGLVDQDVDVEATGFVPAMSALNTRSLIWINDLATPEQRKQFGEFFSQNLGHTLITYIEQAVKRAEYHERFGNDKLKDIMVEAEKFGATEKDLELAQTYVDAVMGNHGAETNKKLSNLLGWEAPRPGEVINPKLQKTMGAMMVYQNLRVLSMATITSLADPIGIAVRTGDIGITFSSFRVGIREAFKHARGSQSELVDMAEMLGVIDREMTVEALNWEYGGEYVTGTARKINEGFFRYTGLQAWTRSTRVMGLEASFRFIRRHVQRPNRQSERLLEELNVSAEDVIFDGDNNLKLLTVEERRVLHEEASETSLQELARDDKVRTAVHRFVDTSILRPNATLRPIWASDPHFMLVFHLKSFMYAFHEVILKRVALEASNGNIVPLLMLGMFIPALIGADELRELIKFGGDGNPRKANWEWDDYAWNAAERAGLYGLGEIALDAVRDIEMGGLGFESFSGPTAQQINELITSEDYSLAEAIPGQNVIKYWDFWETP